MLLQSLRVSLSFSEPLVSMVYYLVGVSGVPVLWLPTNYNIYRVTSFLQESGCCGPV
jgi:hypothetical protein